MAGGRTPTDREFSWCSSGILSERHPPENGISYKNCPLSENMGGIEATGNKPSIFFGAGPRTRRITQLSSKPPAPRVISPRSPMLADSTKIASVLISLFLNLFDLLSAAAPGVAALVLLDWPPLSPPPASRCPSEDERAASGGAGVGALMCCRSLINAQHF